MICPVESLFGLLFNEDSLHVQGDLKHYRNKITYNIPIRHQFSDLAEDRVNEICGSIMEWEYCDTILREIMVKVSRRGEFMVRLTVVGSEGTQEGVESWKASIKEFLLARHPNIVCLCYNEVIGEAAKPSKDYDSFRFLTDQTFLEETTPDGKYTYQISPDTFSEVNTNVEDQQCSMKKICMAEEPDADVLLVSGRDISSFALCYRKNDDQPVVAIQHDVLVHRDALVNLANATVILSAKDEMAKKLQTTIVAHATRVHCVLTGGRHGLDPSYLNYLISNTAIQCILYNSCSTKSLVRDMRSFLRGGFFIDDFRSYDFFPGTKFTASVTKLTRRPRTLILPIGPAGVGKTTLADHLKPFGVECFHRDELYASYAQTLSGKAARRKLHNELLEFLGTKNASPKFVDSTNGDAEGRLLYAQSSQAQHVVLVNFRCTDVDFLLQRTSNRLDDNPVRHPFFPTTVQEQREKHSRILQGIQYYESSSDALGGSAVTVINLDPKEKASSEDLAFRVFCAIHVSKRLLDRLDLGDLRHG